MTEALVNLKQRWLKNWVNALSLWSNYTRLSEPRWCYNINQEKEEKLSGSFAMIRLQDHAVVISLKQIMEMKLEKFSLEIMAHEIGHHIYCPADLTDHGLMIARMRKGLPDKEKHAPFIANLYSDLLINNRLQRSAGLDMAGVYRALGEESDDRMWNFYLRIYEILWGMPRSELTSIKINPVMEADAHLGARLIRVYSRDWLKGAGSFAALCYTYLLDNNGKGVKKILKGWMDTQSAGDGGEPSGLTEIDEGEDEEVVHPSMDERLTGIDSSLDAEEAQSKKSEDGTGEADRGGKKSRKNFRSPSEYGELFKALRNDLTDHDIAIRYYRERAIPYLIRFPNRILGKSSDPMPEGLDTWEVGMPLEKINWFESLIVSPQPIPGVTTVQRTYGSSEGDMPEKQPLNLYIGIDCSGSMPNPQQQISYPVLAGTIMALSALRAGARVMVVLSGEPGSSLSTEGFINHENDILKVLTGYLGTGYAFGIRHLASTFSKKLGPNSTTHMIIITDSDIFMMLDENVSKSKKMTMNVKNGWELADIALSNALGGGTYVLHSPFSSDSSKMKKMAKQGWNVYTISGWDEIILFAKEFSRKNYEDIVETITL